MLPTTFTPSIDSISVNYARIIEKKIRHYIADETISKDIRQEVLIKIWKKLPTYDMSKGSISSWIIAITANTCIDYLRSLRKITRTPPDFSPDQGSDSSAPADCYLRRELLWMADKLSTCQKDAVVMIYFKGFTQIEAAQLLKIPLGTLKTRQRTAILALRKMLLAGSTPSVQ